MNLRDVIPTAENSSNFNVVPESITEVGTTLENLKAAVCGETGASAKYAACAPAPRIEKTGCNNFRTFPHRLVHTVFDRTRERMLRGTRSGLEEVRRGVAGRA